MSVRPSVRPSESVRLRPSVCVRPSVSVRLRPSVCVRPSVHPPVHPSTCHQSCLSYTRLSICWLVCISLFMSVFFCLSDCHLAYVHAPPSPILPMSLHFILFIMLVCIFISLSASLSVYHPSYISVYLSFCLHNFLSFGLFIQLSICLTIELFVCAPLCPYAKSGTY
jgi:hypothetical protein